MDQPPKFSLLTFQSTKSFIFFYFLSTNYNILVYILIYIYTVYKTYLLDTCFVHAQIYVFYCINHCSVEFSSPKQLQYFSPILQFNAVRVVKYLCNPCGVNENEPLQLVWLVALASAVVVEQ